MTPCQDLAVLVSLRAAGALAPEEAERLEAHLAGCERCRAEVAAEAEVLALAKLPPAGAAELRAAAVHPAAALGVMRARDLRRTRVRRAAVVLAALAAGFLAFLAPVLLRHAPEAPATPGAPAAETARAKAWEAPDMETLWDDTAVLDLDGTSSDESASGSTSITEAVLAAADL